ncbi:hypothetical protein BaRGS_00037763 [Batillaria attramentaria]|uniref:Uncharacterized protein n=1 Tax=Batillaria attramentaria TaxID=370345 RepID=A0ABD0J8J9_9CAEN
MCEDPVPYRTQQAIKQRTPCAMCEDPVPYRARQATKQRTPCAMCEDPVPYRAQQATKQRTPCKMCGDPILWEVPLLFFSRPRKPHAHIFYPSNFPTQSASDIVSSHSTLVANDSRTYNFV